MSRLPLYFDLIRWNRPFAPEVIVLERPVWQAVEGERPSLRQRMSQIHSRSSGETMGRGMLFGLLAAGALWIVYLGSASIWGLVSHEWLPLGFNLWVLWPAALWCVAALMAVIRFVNYLDVRIRQEGWEIELLLRSEGQLLEESQLGDASVSVSAVAEESVV